MSDIDPSSTSALNDAMAGLLNTSSAFQKSMKAIMQKEEERERQRAEMSKSRKAKLRETDANMSSLDNKIREFTSSGDSAISFIRDFAQQGKGFLGLGLFSVMAYRLNELSKTWQQLTNNGQTFGGSMTNMLQSAADAGLSLEEFANAYRDHNLVIKETNGGFFDMQKQLRKNISAHGNYGMTVEQITSFMGNNMEVARRNGSLQSKSNSQVVQEMGELALTTTGLANASDKTREQILELANAAMSSSLSIAAIATLPRDIQGQVSKSVMMATAGFASMGGEAGDFFSKFFNDTLGASAALTEQGQTAIDAGMSNIAADMDAVSNKFKNSQGSIDDVIDFQSRFKKSYEAQLPVLKAQAAAGNQAAIRMIQYGAAVRVMTHEELKRAKASSEDTKILTAFFSAFNSVFGMLKGTFVSSFIKSMEGASGKMEEFADSEIFKKINDALGVIGGTLGKRLGEWMNALKTEDIIDFMNGVASVAEGLATFVSGVSIISIALARAFNYVVETLRGVGISLGTVAKTIAGIYLGYKVFEGVMKLKNLFGGKVMNVTAAVVNIKGAGAMSDILGGDGGGGSGKKKRGLFGNLKTRANALGRRGGIGGAIGKFGAKALGATGGMFSRIGGAGTLGKIAGVGGGLLKGGLGALGGIGLGMLADNMEQGSLGQKTVSTGAKAASWAGTGAMIGSVVPGLGTAAGAIAGGSLGALSGLYDAITTPSAKEAEEPKPETLPEQKSSQDQILEQLKRNNEELLEMRRVMAGKMEMTNRLLAKIEVSAQSLS